MPDTGVPTPGGRVPPTRAPAMIPVSVILNPDAGLLGAAVHAQSIA